MMEMLDLRITPLQPKKKKKHFIGKQVGIALTEVRTRNIKITMLALIDHNMSGGNK
jgi:hypothetical protein